MACEERGAAANHGTAVAPVRASQSIRAPGVLHAARVGVEEKSHRCVRELAFQRIMRGLQRTRSLSQVDRRSVGGVKPLAAEYTMSTINTRKLVFYEARYK